MMKKILAISMFLLLTCSVSGILCSDVSAADKKDFNPGRIIDDSVFYNSNSMSPDQIQNFLNSKVPNCDYDGSQSASDWGYPNITHAQLAEYKRNGTNGFKQDTGFHAPPYKCLRVYSQNTPQMEAASGLCGPLSAYSNRTAAQIIKDISSACGINPQVLIVLLEKEQSLITDKWPLNRQLEKATGFACPDTAPCNPEYGGFFYQVYYAARQFKVYQAYPERYNYIAGRSQAIQWSPTASCGSSQVYIQNQATAGLYVYTPYQPNQAALNNLYGTGDSCSAYGNRNFWRIFSDWFGSTLAGQDRLAVVSKSTNTLSAGSTLKPREFLTSPDGRYILMMQTSGQLVMYKSKQIVWMSDSVNWSQEGASLSFQTDGNLVIYKDSKPIWETSTSGTAATTLSLQNDGNLVMYNSNKQAVWSSDSAKLDANLTLIGSSLSTGTKLSVNEYLRSPDWRYFLAMQDDGNLVLYTAGYSQAIWQSNSAGKGGKYAVMQSDGNMVIYGDKGAVWSTGTGGKTKISNLMLQSDGNLVMYSTVGQAKWSSDTAGSGGKYTVMQSDGNMVIYGDKGAVWSTGTNNMGGKSVALQTDGNLVMYGDKGAVWSTSTNERNQSAVAFVCTTNTKLAINEQIKMDESKCSEDNLYKLSFQTDGNLVLYSRKTSTAWTTRTNNVFFKSDLNL